MNETEFKEYLKSRGVALFDSALGTALQTAEQKYGTGSEEMNFIAPETVVNIHRDNLEAGSDIITSNSFGVTQMYMRGEKERSLELLNKAVEIAKRTESEFEGKLVCLGLGPAGIVLGPYGDASYEDAVEAYKRQAAVGARAGADFILLETFADQEEIIRAARVAKEVSGLPVAGTMCFEENGKTYMGATPADFVRCARTSGLAAVGANCSVGPQQILGIVKEIIDSAGDLPVIAQPNAGKPFYEDGRTVYKVSVDDFAGGAKKLIDLGVSAIGGCCGTTPAMISAVRDIIEYRRKK